MAEEILKIRSISELHLALGFPKPTHPLISVINAAELNIDKEMVGIRVAMGLYYIGLKSSECGMQYGRNQYDFQEGVMVFTAPDQVVSPTEEIAENQVEGWMLFFHPDLIRTSSLGQIIDHFTFFSYEAHEALHLSDQEKKTLGDIVHLIKGEYEQRIDSHSQRVIVSSLELLLNYCSRFYERQFNTRTNQNKYIVTRFQHILNQYFQAGKLAENGLPSIGYFASEIHLSPNYLSDLLKKETGRSAKDHINDFLVEKAKDLLLNTNRSVSEIAYDLGFNYPHYFSRLFRARTGMTPVVFRSKN
ncbi:MAG TPA: helix-turn-helix transcriptional regulator [Flavilitoribacter sp.]|nr:helix-turn-helix transcriptional regulator [Flavilitoribacter sp.]HMQ88104.1 helix-turn-helix transcriptional regulator [Flavilitoribacter sp.]